LCAGWATPDHTRIYYYETGGPPDYWKPALKRAPLDALLALGYQPLHYRGMATEARTHGKQVLTRGALAAPRPRPRPGGSASRNLPRRAPSLKIFSLWNTDNSARRASECPRSL